VFYINKLLPLIFSPLFIFIYLIVLNLFRKNKIILFTQLSIFILFTNPIFSNFLISDLEKNSPPQIIQDIQTADAIVVLSGTIGQVSKSGIKITEWGRPNRYLAGIELYRAGKAPSLIFTGGNTPLDDDKFIEGEFLKQKAMRDGVPENHILVTSNSYNTEQEAISLSNVLYSKNIILVTSSFHMTRAKSLFEAHGYKVSPFPVDFMSTDNNISILSFFPSVDALSKVDLYIRENIGRLYYSIKYRN